MDKLSIIYSILSRYKYLVTVAIGLVIVGFADSNSWYHYIVMQSEINDIKAEIAKYNKTYEEDSKQLHALERNSRNIERIARERYFMKADDEDIFVLSTDPRPEDNVLATPTTEEAQ